MYSSVNLMIKLSML